MSSKKRKGLSADDKRKVILGIYHDKKDVFNLKEIEAIASKLGVVQQTVKEHNQSLVDDGLVLSDKIGSANFFWSFPSKAFQDRSTLKDNLQNSNLLIKNSILEYEDKIEEAKSKRSGANMNRVSKLQYLQQLSDEIKSLESSLKAHINNDPEEIKRIETQAMTNKLSADRWTDNIWAIKKYLTKKQGMSGKEADKMIFIDGAFDYFSFNPEQSQQKKMKV